MPSYRRRDGRNGDHYVAAGAERSSAPGGNTILTLTDVNGRSFSLKLAGADENS
jgi:hypothetical protein